MHLYWSASVEVYEYKNGSLGRKLGSAVTPASGHYSIDIESASMPLYIAAKGGSYKDPVSEQVVYENIYMASVTNYTEGSTQKVMVTPLIYLAAGLTDYRIKQGQSAANAVSSSLQDMKAIYSFDVNTTQPIDITKKSVSSGTNGDKYGAILTAYSSFAS